MRVGSLSGLQEEEKMRSKNVPAKFCLVQTIPYYIMDFFPGVVVDSSLSGK